MSWVQILPEVPAKMREFNHPEKWESWVPERYPKHWGRLSAKKEQMQKKMLEEIADLAKDAKDLTLGEIDAAAKRISKLSKSIQRALTVDAIRKIPVLGPKEYRPDHGGEEPPYKRS